MVERRVDLTPHLQAGLLKDSKVPRNVEGMVTLTNVKSEGGSLVYHEPLVNPEILQTVPPTDSPYPSQLWPFPQIFRTTAGLLVIASTALALLPEGTFADPTLIETWDPDSVTENKAIPAGGAWHFWETNTFGVGCNGSCVLLSFNDITTNTGKIFVFDDYIANTTCIHRGRVLFANMSGITPPWLSHFTTLATAGGAAVDQTPEIETRKVWWSSVGGGDETFLFQDPSNIPEYESFLLRNESGYMHMPWSFPILALRPMAEKVIVYGTNGIGALVLSPGLNTYGYQHILDVGIYDRGAQTGDDSIHHFIDGYGYLWSLTADLQATRLGYRNLFLDAAETVSGTTHRPSPIMLTWNSHRKELYISFDNLNWTQDPITYILSEGIATKLDQVVLSGQQSFLTQTETPDEDIFVVSGTPPVEGTITDETEQTFEATTNTIDFGTRDEKALDWIEVSGEGITNLEGMAQFRHSSGGSFTNTPWIKANPDGSIPIYVGGIDFRIAIRGTVTGRAASATRIEGVAVVVSRTDSRDVRGLR